MPGDAAPLDSKVEIITPENIAFDYHVAGPFRRLNAYLIDLVLRGLVLAAFMIFSSPVARIFGGMWIAATIVLWFLLEWFYGGVFETYMNGQTPGKRLIGIRVLTVDGRPINGLQAVLRNVLRSADSMPWISLESLGGPPMYSQPTFVLGLITMAMNSRFQRLGDIVCGTMVVVEERSWYAGMAKIEDTRAMQLADALPAHLPISRTGARALATYVERRRFFTQARRREMARPLAELWIARLGLPADTSYDLLLCSLYYRLFDNRRQQLREAAPPPLPSPSSAPPSPALAGESARPTVP